MLGGSRKVKSLGKHQCDALIELSFVLPLPANEEGIKLAERYVKQHRFEKIEKIVALALNENYTQFVVIAASSQVLKLPQEQKAKASAQNVSYEYDQVIAKAIAQVAKPGQVRKERESFTALPISIVKEMVVQPKVLEKAAEKTEPTQNKKRSRRRGRRGGRNRNQAAQTQAPKPQEN